MRADFPTTMGTMAAYAGGSLVGGMPDTRIRTISSDSRDLGPESLFVPLVGERFDGHDFIETLAAERTIAGFVSMRESDRATAERHGVPAVLCDDTLRALGRIAARHRDSASARMVGITGTNGKTTTKELVYAIASAALRTHKNEKNYNNEIGVPFALLGIRPEHECAVMEMGMNHAGEIERLSRIVRPEIALITNVGEGHLEFLGSVENVARAKAEIVRGMRPGGTIILNRETACVGILEDAARDAGLRMLTFALDADADLRPESYSLQPDRTEIVLGGVTFAAPLYGVHNAANLLAAIAVGRCLGIDDAAMARALASMDAIDKRSQIVRGEFVVINDTYNSNPLSSRSAFASAARVFSGRRLIAVVSDMKELGAKAARYHAEAGREIAASGFELLFAWGELAAHTVAGAREAGMNGDRVAHFDDKRALVDALKKRIAKDDVVLVKGSRSMKMEEVVADLLR